MPLPRSQISQVFQLAADPARQIGDGDDPLIRVELRASWPSDMPNNILVTRAIVAACQAALQEVIPLEECEAG